MYHASPVRATHRGAQSVDGVCSVVVRRRPPTITPINGTDENPVRFCGSIRHGSCSVLAPWTGHLDRLNSSGGSCPGSVRIAIASNTGGATGFRFTITASERFAARTAVGSLATGAGPATGPSPNSPSRVSYYLKRPELLLPVAAGLEAGSAHRQIARSHGCAPSTVTRLSQRLGRHALLFHVLALDHLGPLRETLVADHFEAFARTQDYPFGVATLVGAHSHFLYSLDPAPHARTGRVSPAQLARLRNRPPQDTRGGYSASLARALRAL